MKAPLYNNDVGIWEMAVRSQTYHGQILQITDDGDVGNNELGCVARFKSHRHALDTLAKAGFLIVDDHTAKVRPHESPDYKDPDEVVLAVVKQPARASGQKS